MKAQESVVLVKASSGPCSALLGTLNSLTCLEETSEKKGNVSVTALALRTLLQIPSRIHRAAGETGALDGEPEERSPP